MKKCIIALAGIFVAGTLSLMAEFRFVSIDNCGDATTVVVADSVNGTSANLSGAELHNCGKVYQAKSMKTHADGKTAVVTVGFKRMTEFDDTHLVLKVDGQDQVIRIPVNECCEPSEGYCAAPSGERHRRHGCGGHGHRRHGCH